MKLIPVNHLQFHQAFPKQQYKSEKSSNLEDKNRNLKLIKANDVLRALFSRLDQKHAIKKMSLYFRSKKARLDILNPRCTEEKNNFTLFLLINKLLWIVILILQVKSPNLRKHLIMMFTVPTLLGIVCLNTLKSKIGRHP